MVINEFIKTIEGYYNLKYVEGIQKTMIINYLENKSSDYLYSLLTVLIKTFSGQYKTLPDIAIFESISNEVYEMVNNINIKRNQNLRRKEIEENNEDIEDHREEILDLFKKLKKNAGFRK